MMKHLGALGFFFDDKHWWYVGAYDFVGNGWQRKYARGPMLMTRPEADTEFLDTVEALWGKHTFMWRWVNGTWVLENQL